MKPVVPARRHRRYRRALPPDAGVPAESLSGHYGESNIFADWGSTGRDVQFTRRSDSVRDKASDKDKERVTKNINIMWNALSKNRMFDGNKELKEFVMTLTGSLVFRPQRRNGAVQPEPLTTKLSRP